MTMKEKNNMKFKAILQGGLYISFLCLLGGHSFVSCSSMNNRRSVQPPGFEELAHSMLQHPQQPQHDEPKQQQLLHNLSTSRAREYTAQESSLYEKRTQNLRIHFETGPIEQAIDSTNDTALKEVGQTVVNNVLTRIKKDFYETISIKPNAGLFVQKNVCFSALNEFIPSNYWQLPNADVLIFVGAYDSIGGVTLCNSNPNSSTLASAFPCMIDAINNRPTVGYINVCLNAIQGLSSSEEISDVMSHEILHILILNSQLFKYYRNVHNNRPLTPRNSDGSFNIKEIQCVNGPSQLVHETCGNTLSYREDLISDDETNKRGYYEIVLPTVKQVVRNQFNCQYLTGVRLENQPTNPADCTGSHFDERFFFNNVMSAVYEDGSSHFSPLLLALMEDSGWYKANFKGAENSPFGLNAGCGFVNADCIVGGEVPDYSKGFFCNQLFPDSYFNSKWKCGPDLSYRGFCDLHKMQSPGRSYFPSLDHGPLRFTLSDWCPMVIENTIDCNGMGLISSVVDDIEIFGDNSMCMEVSINSVQQSAMCIESFCDVETQEFRFQVGSAEYSCTFAERGKKISITENGKTYVFTCPNLAQACPDLFCPSMCSGKGICNWEATLGPTCECFDTNDATAGCFNSNPKAPINCADVNDSAQPSTNTNQPTGQSPSQSPVEEFNQKTKQPTSEPTSSDYESTNDNNGNDFSWFDRSIGCKLPCSSVFWITSIAIIFSLY